jgi:hypothetical protein
MQATEQAPPTKSKLVFGDDTLMDMYQVLLDAGGDEDQVIRESMAEFASRGMPHIKYLWTFRDGKRTRSMKIE